MATLEEGNRLLGELLPQLSFDDLTHPATIGGGDWSAKDLIGHIASWEEIALDSLAEWRRGERPAIEDVFGAEAVDLLNAENVQRKATETLEHVLSAAEATHRSLISEILGMTDDQWSAKAHYPIVRRTRLGTLLGSVLGAPKQPFGHAFAHLPDLDAYVASLRTNA